MMKYFFTILLTAAFLFLYAQPAKYFTRDGVIKFTSDAPFEKVESTNKEVNILIDPASAAIAFKVVMKSFAFDRQGMKDHFNADYLQTDKFPNATFEGTVLNFNDWSKNGTYTVAVSGKLMIHGVTKTIKQSGKISIEDGKISVSGNFNILLTDYGITVPSNYVSKISNTITIQVNGVLTPYQR